MQPDAVAAFAKDHAELSNSQNANIAQERARLATARKAVKRKLEGIYDAIDEGLGSSGLNEKLLGLETRAATIEEALDRPAPPRPRYD